MTPPPTCLRGLEILVVEDEALVAMALEDLLDAAGCRVIGPAASVAQAMALLDRKTPVGALLDVNLAGELSSPVAVELKRRGVPFVVVTGYEELVVGEPALQDAPRLRKPVQSQSLLSAMERAFC